MLVNAVDATRQGVNAVQTGGGGTLPDTEDRTLEPGEQPRRAVPRVVWYIGMIVVFAVAGSIVFAARAGDDRPSSSLSLSPTSSSSRSTAPCPAEGGDAIVDWVQFIRFDGRTYLAQYGTGPRTIDPSQRGRVIGNIRCSLSDRSDPNRETKDFPDGTAPFLPVGAALYEIRGYTVSCRIAAEDQGKLVVYLAEHEVNGKSAPVCGNDHSPPP